MKKNIFLSGLALTALASTAMLQSCMSEVPFGNGDGEGRLRMKLVLNSDLTRAQIEDDTNLQDSCVVYISGANGLVHKYKGLNNVPEEILLKSGNYVLEAWTGDSVPASFDKRFYRGYEEFSISADEDKAVSMTCRIANVVVSIDTESIQLEEMPQWELKVFNSSGDVCFTKENMQESAYFMMPNADIARDADGNIRKAEDGWSYYTNLTYQLEGTTAAGEKFSKTGAIGRERAGGVLVEHAHDYRLKFEYNPEYEETGGSFITIKVIDTEIENDPYEFGIYSKPSIKGYDFDIVNDQVFGQQGAFQERMVKVSGFGGLKAVTLTTDDYKAFRLPQRSVNLVKMTDEANEEVRAVGLDWKVVNDESRDLETYYVILGEDFLNNLDEREDEYQITITAEDNKGKASTEVLHIAVGEGAIRGKDAFTIDAAAIEGNLLAIRANYATISGIILDEEAQNPRIQYREKSGGSWNDVTIQTTRSGREYSVVLTDLKPGTTYEARPAADGYEDSANVFTFTTETKYTIENGDMESWMVYDSKKYDVPTGNDGQKSYWDNGNKGASTVTLHNICAKTSEKTHGGQFAAKLETQTILSQLAAGNLFVGDFVSATISPLGAKLNFGKPFNGSHPEALKVWAHYTPAQVNKGGDKISTSQKDRGQVYIAIVNGQYSIDTGNKKYFDKDSAQVLGYGEYIWDGVGTPGSAMEEIKININWKPSAKTTQATHLVIVCSASMYGDFFQGGDGSVMYLDDFELIY